MKLTRDGVPILMHDDTLDRTTNGTGNVADTDWADIQKLDAGSWFDSRFRGENRAASCRSFTLHARCRLAADDRDQALSRPCQGDRDGHIDRGRQALAARSCLAAHPRASIAKRSSLPLNCSRNGRALFRSTNGREDWREFAKEIGAEAIAIDADIITRERMIAIVAKQACRFRLYRQRSHPGETTVQTMASALYFATTPKP